MHVANMGLLHAQDDQYTHGLAGVSVVLDAKFTWALWIVVLVLLLILIVFRWEYLISSHLRQLLTLNRVPLHYWAIDRASLRPLFKRHLSYAPLFRHRYHREAHWNSLRCGSLPSRLQFLLLAGYIGINLVYCICLQYTSTAASVAQLRGRSGHLALVNMLPLVLLAGRNNPLISLLGISFDTMNLIHRWIGRLVVVLAVVHTWAWAVNEESIRGSLQLADNRFLHSGLVGTVAMLGILLQSPSVVRHAFYETFLHCHQLLALITIFGVWIHCHAGKLPGTAYVHWILAVWVVERSIRLLRLLYLNVSASRRTKFHVELGSQVCRVSVDLARPFVYRPGTHCYLYIPSLSLWMSHPFSIAWSRGSHIEFLVSRRSGMTRKLHDLATTSGSLTLSGFVEGPYGGLQNLRSYHTVVLFAGGIGITHQIGYVRDLLDNDLAAARKITLVWSVRDSETLEWVRPWMDEILACRGCKLLRVMIFVTRDPKSEKCIISPNENIQLHVGQRCSPANILETEMQQRVGAVAVTCCGPGALGDDVRAAVRAEAVSQGVCDYFEEAFTW